MSLIFKENSPYSGIVTTLSWHSSLINLALTRLGEVLDQVVKFAKNRCICSVLLKLRAEVADLNICLVS